MIFDRYEADDRWHLVAKFKDSRDWLPSASFAVFDRTLAVGKPRNFSDEDNVDNGGVSIFRLPEIGNHPPAIEAIGDVPLTATVAQLYSSMFSVVDPDNDPIVIELAPAPSWLTLRRDEATVTVSGTPPEGTAGEESFVVKATDPSGFASRYSVHLEVGLAPNSPPLVKDSLLSRSAALGRDLVLEPSIFGPPPIDIAWEKDGVTIPGQISDSLTVSVSSVDDAGVYTIVVTNAFGVASVDLLDLDVVAIENAALVPSDYPDIQSAIDAAIGGSLIVVEPGDYPSSINFVGKDITVRSLDGARFTSIDTVTDPAVAIGPGGSIEGFTIRSRLPGNRPSAAVRVVGDGTTIRANVFDLALDFMIHGVDASPLIDGNLLSRGIPTSSTRTPAGILFEGNSSPRIINNVFGNLRGSDILVRGGSEVIGTPQIINNTFVNSRNSIELPFPRDGKEGDRLVRNNVFFGTAIPILPQLFSDERFFDFTSNLLFPNLVEAQDPNVAAVLENNVVAEPEFVSIEARDYRLLPDSAGIDQGTSTAAPEFDFRGNTRPMGERIDIGAFEGINLTAPPPRRTAFDYRELLNAENSVSIAVADLFQFGQVLAYSYTVDDPNGMIEASELLMEEVVLELNPDASGFAEVTIRAEASSGAAIEAPAIIYRRPQFAVNVPRDYPTIYDAVDAVTGPATITLAPGTYGTSQLLDFEDKDIALIGSAGMASTVVVSPIQWIPKLEEGFAEIRGITFRPSSDDSEQSAFRALGRHALFAECLFEDFKGTPLNLTHSDDWRIIERCIFRNNTGEATTQITSRCLVMNNVFENNSGYGVGIASLGPEFYEIVTTNTFVDTPGVTAWADAGALPRRVIQNNVFDGGKYALTMPTAHSLVWQNNLVHSMPDPYPGGPDRTGKAGNIAENPLFADRAAGNYRLTSDSPAVDAGNSEYSTTIDFDGNPRVQGSGIDIGAFELESASLDPAFAIERTAVLPDGRVLIEFPSTPGQQYEVEYGEDGISWVKSPERIDATTDRVQWIDSGPPVSVSHPSGNRQRFYRVLELRQP